MNRSLNVRVKVVLLATHYHQLVVKILMNVTKIRVVLEQFVKISPDVSYVSVRVLLMGTHMWMAAYLGLVLLNAVILNRVLKVNNVFYTMGKMYVFVHKGLHAAKKLEYAKILMNVPSTVDHHVVLMQFVRIYLAAMNANVLQNIAETLTTFVKYAAILLVSANHLTK